MASPRVSILIPTRDRAALLVETVGSLQAQSLADWEAIVVDDGSTDRTRRALQELGRRDPRVAWLPRTGAVAGAPACRNQGLSRARSDYVIFLDSDDLLAPDALRQRLAVMEGTPHLDFAVFPCELFESRAGDRRLLWNVPSKEPDLDRLLRLDVPWQTTGPIWRRDALRRLGAWNEALPSWQDWELHLRALALGLRYERHGTEPDCYWRLPGAHSIGRLSVGQEHLRSHERLLGEVAQLLRRTNTWTATRGRLLAGLHYWLAETWAQDGQVHEALRVWAVCQQRGLLPEGLWQQGHGYLRLWMVDSLRRACRIWQEQSWPPGIVFQPSRTFRQVPCGQASLVTT